MGDRIALLRGGRLMQVGRAEELYQRPADLFVAGFFSELNLFEARVSGGMADTPVGRVAAPGFADGTKVTVAVRLSGFDVGEVAGAIPARVLTSRFLGVVDLVDLAVPGADRPVRARVRCGVLSYGGRDIFVSVRPADVLVFESHGENA